MANEIKTRILLKYDSQANWEASSFILKQGEAAVCEMTPVVEAGQSVILVKYGNGKDKFIDLPWASAPAADVHGWAKQSPEDFIKWVNENIEHPAAPVITTGTENGTIAVDGTDVAVKGLGSAAYTSADAYAPADIDTGVHAVDLATGETNGTVKLTVDGADKEVAVAGLQDAAYATVASLNATAKGYADAVEAKLPTELGVMSVANADDTIVVGGDGKNVTVKVAADKFDAWGAAAEALAEAKTYADNNDANTEYHVEYDSENKKIKLVAGADASKMEIDATDFIKDGMIDTVTIGADNDLIITFNTVSGKDDIVLPLDQLVDIYTGVDGAKVKVSVSADKKISADIVAGSIAKTDLAADVQTSLGLADTALQEHQDISHLASKTDVIVALAEAEAYADTLNAAMDSRMTEVADKVAALADEDGAKALAQEVKDVITENKETWDKAGTALQAADLNGYAKTTEVTEAIEGAIEGEVARADGAYAPKTATAQGIENANAAAEAAQGTANNAKSLAEAALPKATAETDYLKKTDAATTYRAKQDKITPTDLSEDVFIFDCGSATKNID